MPAVGDPGAVVVAELARWLPLLWRFIRALGGDRRKALREIRRIELAEREARDQRMGR